MPGDTMLPIAKPCAICGVNPRKYQRTKCGRCAWLAEDRQKGTARRTAFKRRARRAAGCRTRAEISAEAQVRAFERAQIRKARPKPLAPYIALGLTTAQARRMMAKLKHYLKPRRRRVDCKASRWAAMAQASSDGSITLDSIIALLLSSEACCYCQIPLALTDRSIDHAEALAIGGAHSLSNLVVCCVRCNRIKGGKLGAQLSPFASGHYAGPWYESQSGDGAGGSRAVFESLNNFAP